MKSEIERTVEALLQGGIIVYPTDSVWGIGCDATLEEAVERVFSVKQRNDRKAMLILVESVDMLEKYVATIPDLALEILSLTDKPLTIIYPGARNLAPNLIHKDGSIGIRITMDPFCKGLLRAFGKPIVSTSANLAGSPAPALFGQISETILELADYVTTWRRQDHTERKPSGILKIGENGEIEVVRR